MCVYRGKGGFSMCGVCAMRRLEKRGYYQTGGDRAGEMGGRHKWRWRMPRLSDESCESSVWFDIATQFVSL